jgi:hypothetical protein
VVLPRRDMGKSALRLVAKMAKVHPVFPRPDSKGIAQPPYTRGATAIQTAPRVNFIKSCVAQRLAGQKFGSRLEVRKALEAAAKECSAKADERKLPKRAGR